MDESSQKPSWVMVLPDGITQFLLGVYLIASQWNPCDAVSVSEGSSLFLMLLGTVIGLITAIDRMLDEQKHRISIQWKLLISAFYIWLAFATYQVYGEGDLRLAMLGFWQAVSILGFVSGFYHQATKAGRLESALRWILGTVGGTVAMALCQYFYLMPHARAEFQADPMKRFMQEGIIPGSAEALQWQSRFESVEPLGPFALTNSLAGFVGAWMIVVLGAIIWLLIPQLTATNQQASQAKNWIRRYPSYFLTLWILAIGSLAVVFFTNSRTAWGAVLITGCALLAGTNSLAQRSWRSLQSYWSIAAPVLLVVGMIGTFLVLRNPNIFNNALLSLSYRVQYWEGAFELVEQSPWFGTGPLNFQENYPKVKMITASESPADPHNMWFEIMSWGGFPGLLIAIAMAIGLLQLFAVNAFRISGDSREGALLVEGKRKTLLPIDFGAAFGLVGTVAFASLSPDRSTLMLAILFSVVAFYVTFSLVGPGWGRFVQDNVQRIGILLCTFMGVHLFFSGGWMQPGAMSPLVIGAPLAFVGPRARPVRSDDLNEWSPWTPLLAWATLLVVFMVTTFTPENRLASWELDLDAGEFNQEGSAEWRNMLKIHPRAPKLASQIAYVALSKASDPQWSESTRSEWLAVYDEAKTELTKRSPSSWSVRDRIGRWDWSLSDRLGRRTDRGNEYFKSAVENLDQAARWNPISIPVQLQDAAIQFSAGEFEKAKERMAQVENIENLTPHTDRKLAASSIYLPESIRDQLFPNGRDRVIGSAIGEYPAEPVFLALRSLLGLSK